MQNIPIQALPSQKFSIVLNGNNFEIGINFANGIMAATISINNILIIENLRVVANTKVIPSKYEENGNFIFTTLNFQLPDYAQFGISQNLIYASPDELVALRTPTPPRITADYFNPIAALPLRFSPQGY